MNKLFFLAVFFGVASASANSKSLGNRTYQVYAPTKLGKMPLMIVLHGATMNGESMRRYTQMDALAERKGFVVAYPDGHKIVGSSSYRYWTPTKEASEVDLHFMREMILEIQRDYDIDLKRVYVVGLSNGGFLANYMGCEMADVVSGVATVGSTIEVRSCKPKRALSSIHIHGTKDNLVKEGGGGPKKLRSQKESLRFLLETNRCNSTPKSVPLPDLAEDGTTAVLETYSDCTDGTEIQYVRVHGGGHTWPGRPNTWPYAIGRKIRLKSVHTLWDTLLGVTSMDFSANEMIWEFFKGK